MGGTKKRQSFEEWRANKRAGTETGTRKSVRIVSGSGGRPLAPSEDVSKTTRLPSKPERQGQFSRLQIEKVKVERDTSRALVGTKTHQDIGKKVFAEQSIGKNIGFGVGLPKNASLGQLREATGIAAAKKGALSIYDQQLGDPDIGGIIGGIRKLASANSPARTIQLVEQQYGKKVANKMRGNLQLIEKFAPELLQNSRSRGRVPGFLGGMSPEKAFKKISNISNPEKLKQMTQREAFGELLTGGLALAGGGFYFQLPIPGVRTQEFESPTDTQAFPEYHKVQKAVRGFARETRDEMGKGGKGNYSMEKTKAGAELAAALPTGRAINAAFPVRDILNKLFRGGKTQYDVMREKQAQLLQEGKYAEALKLGGRIEAKGEEISTSLARKNRSGRGTADSSLAEGIINEDKTASEAVNTRLADTLGGDKSGFIEALGKIVGTDLSKYGKTESEKKLGRMLRGHQSGQSDAHIKGDPLFDELFNQYMKDNGGKYASYEKWLEKHILPPQNTVSGGAGWGRGRKSNEELIHYLHTSKFENGENLGLKLKSILESSGESGEKIDIGLDQVYQAIRQLQDTDNIEGSNNLSRWANKMSNNKNYKGPLRFGAVYAGSRRIMFGIKGDCNNPNGLKVLVPGDKNVNVYRTLEIPLIIPTGGGGGGGGGSGGRGPNVSSSTGFGGSGVVPSL